MIGKLLLGILLLVGWLLLGPDLSVVPASSTATSSVEQPIEVSMAHSSISAYAVVTQVIDGDTIVIEGGERVRLLGIDTPEYGECYFTEAKNFLYELVAERTVRLEADASERDKYGRLLRHVFVETAEGEQYVNEVLVAGGYAVVLPIPPDRRYREKLLAFETAANTNKLGLWGLCE